MVKRFLDLGGTSNNQNFFFGKAKKKDFEQVSAEIRSFNPWDSVIIYGGEPTARKDFFRILGLITSRGINKIFLLTNGRAFNYSSFAAKLKKIKGLKVFIELLAPTQEEHDKLTGTPGSFRQTMNGIENLQEKGVEFSLVVPVIEENISQLFDFGELASIYEIGDVVLHALTSGVGNVLWQLSDKFPLLFRIMGANPRDIPPVIDICKELEDLNLLDLDQFPRLKITRALERFHDKSLIYVSVNEACYLLDKLSEKPNFFDFAHYVGFPIPVLLYLFQELEKENLVRIQEQEINLRENPNRTKPAKSFRKHRLEEDPKVCQLRVEEEDLSKRADFIEGCCLGGGRIAVLGDDDFFSLVLASKNIFEEVYVFELDERICDKIERIAREYGYNIRIVKQDLRKTFSSWLLGKFDAFYTDCPYSVNGFTLFFSRGLQLLKNKRKKSGFVSFSPNLFIESVEMGVQKVINDSGVFVERKNQGAINEMPKRLKSDYGNIKELKHRIDNYKDINENDSWFLASLGRKEQLFHFLTTGMSRPLITGHFDGEIYYGESPLAYYVDKEGIEDSKSRSDIFKY